MWLIVVIVIGLVIWAYSSAKKSEREQEEARKKRERENYIRKYYPNAYLEYWGKSVDPSPYFQYHGSFGRYSTKSFRKADITFTDSEWAELEKRVKNRREAEKKEREAKEWEKAQSNFAARMRTLAGETLTNYGNYTYTYNITTKGGTHLNMKIWQHFTFEVCLEKDLDYTYNQLALGNTNNLARWKEKGLILTEQGQNYIKDFISKIAVGKKVVILCNENVEGWAANALLATYTHIHKPEGIKKINVMAQRALGFEDKSGLEQLVQETPDCVVVIDAFTTNDQLKKNCESIFTALQDKHPVLAYISLVKAYDRAEMVAYIERSKAEAEKRAAEEKAKEEERKRREAEELAERKRKEEERARLQATARQVLTTNANEWEHLYGNFHHTWLLYYYPTTCDFEASESEWDDRYTVWNFKNDPDKHISEEDHEAALDEVIPQIKQKLTDTFGAEYLQFITLVCLPASTNAKNQARYEEFSNRLCAETEMENGYQHVHIVRDGLSKKDPRNTTGRSIQPEVTFDDCFKGKYVLLFDDVITKGGTMLRYKEIMERKGATVIGGFTIGKTKHERPVVQQRFVPVEPPPRIFNDDEDLPF